MSEKQIRPSFWKWLRRNIIGVFSDVLSFCKDEGGRLILGFLGLTTFTISVIIIFDMHFYLYALLFVPLLLLGWTYWFYRIEYFNGATR